jgi:GNAT superfamily N-acetyltransferase
MNIHIRVASLLDMPLLAGWAQAMAWETEQKILPDADILGGTRRALEQATLAQYFIAEIADQPVGCLMLTNEWSDWRNGLWWWIQSVFVRPEFRRRGVYRALYAHIQELAAQNIEVHGIRLYVEKENINAQHTYQALGMHDACYKVFEQTTRNKACDS